MEAPEAHGHAHHGTGIKWIDLAFACSALFVSLISLWLALKDGNEMGKLVQANSMPYLQLYGSSLEDDLKTPAIRVFVENQGVGPARIAEVAVRVDGKPVGDVATLLDRCCEPGLLASEKAGKTDYDARNGDIITSTLRDRMVRAGGTVDMIDWRITPANRAMVAKFGDAMRAGRVTTTICYCSVFDECWTRTLVDRQPEPVKDCSPAAVPYKQ